MNSQFRDDPATLKQNCNDTHTSLLNKYNKAFRLWLSTDDKLIVLILIFQNGIHDKLTRPSPLFFSYFLFIMCAAASSWSAHNLMRTSLCSPSASSAHLVQGSDVVLSEHAAQSLVDPVSCPSEAVLVAAAAPASARFGCAQKGGGKHQENHKNPALLHGSKRSAVLSTS